MGQCFLGSAGAISPAGGTLYGHLIFKNDNSGNIEDYFLAEKYRVVGGIPHKMTIGLGITYIPSATLEYFKGVKNPKDNQLVFPNWNGRLQIGEHGFQIMNKGTYLKDGEYVPNDYFDYFNMYFWDQHNEKTPKMTWGLNRSTASRTYNLMELWSGDDGDAQQDLFAFYGQIAGYHSLIMRGCANPSLTLAAGITTHSNGLKDKEAKAFTEIYKAAGYNADGTYYDFGTILRDSSEISRKNPDHIGYTELALKNTEGFKGNIIDCLVLNNVNCEGTQPGVYTPHTYPILHTGNLAKFFTDYLNTGDNCANLIRAHLPTIKSILQPTGTYFGNGGNQTISANSKPSKGNTASFNYLTGEEECIYVASTDDNNPYVGIITSRGGICWYNSLTYVNIIRSEYANFNAGKLMLTGQGYASWLNVNGVEYVYQVL